LGIVLQELLRPVESHAGRWRWRPRLLFAAWRIRHLSQIAGRMTARRPSDRFADFQSVSRVLERTESLPRRRVTAFSAIAGVLALFVVSFVVSFGTPADSRDSRRVDSQLAATTVENEWKRWQQPELVSSSQKQLDGQLAAQFEQWRSAYGKATADMIVGELRRRLAFLSGGQYELRVLSAVPNKYFKQFNADDTADVVTVVLKVEEKDVAKLRGRVSPEQPAVFDQDKLTFSWQPGSFLGVYIETESPANRKQTEQLARESATYEAAKARGELAIPPMVAPKRWEPPIVWGYGEPDARGGVMAVVVDTKCTQVDGDSFFGQFNAKNIDWRLEIKHIK